MALTFWKHLCDNGRLVNMVNFCKDCPTTLHEHYVGSKMPLIQFSAILRDMLKQHNIQTTLLNPGDKSYKEMVKIMSPQEYQSQYGDRRGLYRMRLELNRRHFGQPTVMPPFQAENLVKNVDKILTSDPVSDVYTPTFSEFLTYADYLRRAPKYVNLPMLRKLMTKFI